MPSLQQTPHTRGLHTHIRTQNRANLYAEISATYKCANANLSTEYASILKIIRTPEPTASENRAWRSVVVSLRMGGFSTGAAVPRLLASVSPLLSRSRLTKRLGKTKTTHAKNHHAKTMLAFKTANQTPKN